MLQSRTSTYNEDVIEIFDRLPLHSIQLHQARDRGKFYPPFNSCNFDAPNCVLGCGNTWKVALYILDFFSKILGGAHNLRNKVVF